MRRTIVGALVGASLCGLVATTTASADSAPTARSGGSSSVQPVQQDEDQLVWVALDSDGDRRYDDANRDGKPDRWFKVAKKFLKNCGGLLSCVLTPPGWPMLLCALPQVFTCLDAYDEGQ